MIYINVEKCKVISGGKMNIIVEKMTNEYIDDLLVRAAHHSTAIEGNTLTFRWYYFYSYSQLYS